MKHINPKLLRTDNSDERYKFLLENHKKLIKVLEDLPDAAHEQDIWLEVPKDNPCGTTGCALGWAVASGEFTGLGYYNYETHDGAYKTLPAINEGYIGDAPCDDSGDCWETVGEAYFGISTTCDIFVRPTFSRTELITALTKRVRELMARLAQSQPYRAQE